jgi:hypothetical protein
MSTVSRVEYLANYAIDIAETANNAATNADNAISRLENFFNINTNATPSIGVNITMRNYYETGETSGYGNAAVRVGNAVTIVGDDGKTEEGDLNPGIMLRAPRIALTGGNLAGGNNNTIIAL